MTTIMNSPLRSLPLLILFLGHFFMFGCGGKRIGMTNASPGKKEGVFSVWGSWVKDKGNKFDIRVHVSNETERDSLIVMLHDIHCFKGNMRGEMRHTFFNTGERTIDLMPGEHKQFNAVCDLKGEAAGTDEYKIVIRRIYKNPYHDGATKGDVIADNIVWNSSAAESTVEK